MVYKEEITAKSSRSYYKCTVVMICNFAYQERERGIGGEKEIYPQSYTFQCTIKTQMNTVLFFEDWVVMAWQFWNFLQNFSRVSYFWGCLFHIFIGKQIQKLKFLCLNLKTSYCTDKDDNYWNIIILLNSI